MSTLLGIFELKIILCMAQSVTYLVNFINLGSAVDSEPFVFTTHHWSENKIMEIVLYYCFLKKEIQPISCASGPKNSYYPSYPTHILKIFIWELDVRRSTDERIEDVYSILTF